MNNAAFVLLLLAACGSAVDVGEPGKSDTAQTDDSAEVSFDIRGLWAKLCTDGPPVNDCLRDCIKHHDRPWCGRFAADCKEAKGLDAELCAEWSAVKP